MVWMKLMTQVCFVMVDPGLVLVLTRVLSLVDSDPPTDRHCDHFQLRYYYYWLALDQIYPMSDRPTIVTIKEDVKDTPGVAATTRLPRPIRLDGGSSVVN